MSLRELRDKRGLSLRQLSAKTGIPHSNISNFETRPETLLTAHFDTVLRLADALRVSNPRKLLEDSQSLKENNAA